MVCTLKSTAPLRYLKWSAILKSISSSETKSIFSIPGNGNSLYLYSRFRSKNCRFLDASVGWSLFLCFHINLHLFMILSQISVCVCVFYVFSVFCVFACNGFNLVMDSMQSILLSFICKCYLLSCTLHRPMTTNSDDNMQSTDKGSYLLFLFRYKSLLLL